MLYDLKQVVPAEEPRGSGSELGEIESQGITRME